MDFMGTCIIHTTPLFNLAPLDYYTCQYHRILIIVSKHRCLNMLYASKGFAFVYRTSLFDTCSCHV